MNHIPPTRITVPKEDRDTILRQVDSALTTGQLTLGDHGKAFEEEFATAVLCFSEFLHPVDFRSVFDSPG